MEKAIVQDKEINIDETINKAVKEAIKEYDKEKKVEQRKNVFHNTRLLLKHYNELKNHVENAVDDINKVKNYELFKSDYVDMEKIYDETYIRSIKRSKTRTLIMISHIDVAMETLRNTQKALGTMEKYLALEKFYKDRKSYEIISEDLNCSVITARRWINEMVSELSINLFGIEGIKVYMI